MVSPRRRAASIAFDRVAARYDQTRGGEARGAMVADALEPHLGGASTVLEVGVGTGLVGGALADRGRTVVGVDLSVPMLERARPRLGARLAAGDALRLPIRTGAVPAVIAIHLLHLVADVDEVVAEVARVLEPGGVFVVSSTLRPSDDDEADDAMAAIIRPLMERFRPDQDASPLVEAAARAAGLEHETTFETAPEVSQQSANELAEALETHLWAWTWEVPPEEWEAMIVPAIAALRALPQPGAPRQRAVRHELVVCHAPTGRSAPPPPATP